MCGSDDWSHRRWTEAFVGSSNSYQERSRRFEWGFRHCCSSGTLLEAGLVSKTLSPDAQGQHSLGGQWEGNGDQLPSVLPSEQPLCSPTALLGMCSSCWGAPGLPCLWLTLLTLTRRAALLGRGGTWQDSQEIRRFFTQLSREVSYTCDLTPQAEVVNLPALPSLARDPHPRRCVCICTGEGWQLFSCWLGSISAACLTPCVRGSCGGRRLERFLLTLSIAESSCSLTIRVSLAPKIFANYCCAPLLSCPFLSLCSFPVAFDSINQSLVPNLVTFQLPCYSLSALWEMKAWKCV